jgi:hypothetical protein
MGYENIPTVFAEFPDGNLRTSTTSAQPRILILGAASSGLSYEIYQVTNVGAAETEFGATSEVIQKLHEVIKQGSDNVAIMRIGGKQGSCVLTSAVGGGTVTFTTFYRDDAVLDRYSLVVTNDGSSNRYLVWDNEADEWVYDTDEEKAIDNGVIRVVEFGTVDLMSIGDIDDPDTAYDNVLLTGTPCLGGTDIIAAADWAELASVAATDGTDGTSMSLVERYAALNHAYQVLDFRDGDYVIPCNVHLDDANVVDGDTPDFSSVPTAGSAADVLGYVWQYIYRGKLYTYFSEDDDLFSTYATLAIGGITGLTFTAVAGGPAGEDVTIEVVDNGGGATTIGVVGNAITINVDIGGPVLWSAVKTSFDLSAPAVALASCANTDGSGNASVTAATALDHADEYLTHNDLTGDQEPAAVLTRFKTGSDVELREVNFAHQLGSFCYNASVNWKDMIGFISTLPPTAYDRYTVADWVGNLPSFTDAGTYEYVDSSADNGFGLLGNKFMAGKAGSSSDGYRDHLVTDGDANDGYAYGGLILTVGASLPNELPYGVLDSDEATDSNGKPIDLGKHLFITYDHWIHRNDYNGGTRYRGSIEASLAGKFSVTDVRREPIGPSNGLITGGSRPCHIKYPQLNDLAGARMIGLRREDNVGYILVSAHTAAHPDSDYTKLSTIRCVNRTLANIRTICKGYLGEAFTSSVLASLNQAIEGYLISDRTEGYNNGAVHSLSYSNTDRILGRLTVYVKMVPPGSIEAITVSVSLAADESEL